MSALKITVNKKSLHLLIEWKIPTALEKKQINPLSLGLGPTTVFALATTLHAQKKAAVYIIS